VSVMCNFFIPKKSSQLKQVADFTDFIWAELITFKVQIFCQNLQMKILKTLMHFDFSIGIVVFKKPHIC